MDLSTFVVTATINVFSDIVIIVLPLFKVWRLKLPVRRKIGVGAVFATGILYVNPIWWWRIQQC